MRRDRRGVAAVELALLLPLLLLLFVIACDFSRALYYTAAIYDCARAGALYASDTTISDKSPYASAEEAALAEAGDLNPKPTVSVVKDKDVSGMDYAEVTISYPFQMFTSYPGIPRPMTLSRKVRMRVTHPDP